MADTKPKSPSKTKLLSKSKTPTKLKTVAKSKPPARLRRLQHPEAVQRVTIILRPAKSLPDPHHSVGLRLPRQRSNVTYTELAAIRGANPEDIERVQTFAQLNRLKVEEIHTSSRAVVLSGTEQAVFDVFGGRDAAGPGSVPAALADCADAVFGLHHIPVLSRDPIALRHRESASPSKARSNAGLTVKMLEQAYDFPPQTNGSGQTIALLEFGGGFHRSDMEAYFKSLGLKVPKITEILIEGAHNTPAPDSHVHQFFDIVEGRRKLPRTLRGTRAAEIEAAQCTVETTMDVQMAGALAPGAHLLVYFAPPTEQGIYHALTHAVRNRRQFPSVISISWGQAETEVSSVFAQQIDRVLQDAAHLGITVCASSGDSGAQRVKPDGKPAVNFPASSPHCLGCGGTNVKIMKSRIQREVVWNAVHHRIHGASGGGISRRFPLPDWQHPAGIPHNPDRQPGRGVPDVAGPADPICGVPIWVAGRASVSCGTSAVAPFWAALIARINQLLDGHKAGSRCGFLNPLLYHLARTQTPFREMTRGNNGVYSAGPGWNPCTGLGSPMGDHLVRLLTARRLG